MNLLDQSVYLLNSKPANDQWPHWFEALNCTLVNCEKFEASKASVGNRINRLNDGTDPPIAADSLADSAARTNDSPLMQKPSGSSLDHNNNHNPNNSPHSASSSVLQFKNNNKKATSTTYSSSLKLITESEPHTETIGSILYKRPPVLKHQPKTGSLSSTTSSSSGGSAVSGSSFDSTTLSIENLTALYPLFRTDSLDKVACERILTAQPPKSSLINSHPHGKIARLERNLTDHRISTSSLNKISKSIGQRSQSQDEMNYNVRLQNSSSSGLQDGNKANPKTGSITNVSNPENPLLDQSLCLNKELEKLRQQQELEKQLMLKKLEQQQAQQQQHLLEQHKERIRAIQTKDFSTSNKIIEEEHRQEVKENKEDTNLSSNSIASLEVRKRLKDKIKLKQNGAIASGQQQPAGMNSPANWSTRFKYNEDLIPLKKAASEPNLKVKSALKQKVMHRRCSPLLKRKQKRFGKGPMHLVQSGDSNTHSAPVSASSSMESSTPPNSKPESIPGSPPAFVCGSITTGNSASSTPQYNEPSNIQSSPFNTIDNHLYSSPSLPNISRHHPVSDVQRRFYPFGPSTSPTLFHYQKLKQHFKQKIESEANQLVGTISANQSFINTAAALAFRKAHNTPLLSNSVDSPITRDSSPPAAQNLRSQLESSPYTSTSYTPYAVNFRPLSKKLNRTQSAPLPFGLPLLQAAAAAVNQQANQTISQNTPPSALNAAYSPLANTAFSPLVNSGGPIDTQQLVKQRVRQSILSRNANRQQKQLQKTLGSNKKPGSFDELPDNSEKKLISEKNVDSGSGSFDENYSDSKTENSLIEQIQQHINHLAAASAAADTGGQMKLGATSPPPAPPLGQPASDELNRYNQQLLMLLLQQQQQQVDPALLTSISGNNQLINQLNSGGLANPLAFASQTPLAATTAAGQFNQLNYARLLMNNQIQQANGLKRALSSPMVSPSSLYSNLFASPAAALLNQPSLTSLVGPFSGLNLSQTNINLIGSATHSGSGPNSPDLINENSTALVTDEAMLKHDCVCQNTRNHLESSDRLLAIIKRLFDSNLTTQCCQLPARKATLEELESVHSSTYCQFFAGDPSARQKLESSIQLSELPIKSYVRMACGGVGIDSDTAFNETYTWSAVRAAAGCVIDLASLVAKNKLKNGFAIVRPPGHHAEHQQPMGFCFFNNVAIAAKQLKAKHGIRRILILDWDIHHGNGTQKAFYDDDSVLYISLHRHDGGHFYPGTGDASECGAGGSSLGKTINISWYGSVNYYGDAEYLAAFRSVILPVINEFKPEMVLVSCGFDAAEGHPPQLGGYNLTPSMFAWMTNELVQLNNGRKLVLALEGGYHLPSICDSAEQVVKALLSLPLAQLSDKELTRRPNAMAVETLQKVCKVQGPYWKCLDKPNYHLMECSHFEALTSKGDKSANFPSRHFSPITCKTEEEDEPMEDN